MTIETLIEGSRFSHSRQVAKISLLLAEHAGYTSAEASVIEQAALYHDVGKVDIPPRILNKPGKLTPEEFAVVKTHTELGYIKINEAIKALTVAAEVSRDHHERPDGGGYAHRPGADIHPFAKLIAVADVFDALYSKRAYKIPWNVEEIRTFFSANSGTQFDSEYVMLLFSVLGRVLSLYREECV